jgi:hypothetical protein
MLHLQGPNDHNAIRHAGLSLSCTNDSNAHSPYRYQQYVEQNFAMLPARRLSVHVPLRSQRGGKIISRARDLLGYTTDPVGTLADVVLVNC